MQIVYYHFFNQTGYSCSAQDYILSMTRTCPEINVKSVPINPTTHVGIGPNRNQLFAALTRKPITSPFVVLTHTTPDRFKKLKGSSRNVGFCLYETIGLPPAWVTHMNKMDRIVTASDFNRQSFMSDGVTVPIFTVPHCFDERLFNQDCVSFGRYQQFTFMGLGTWKQRKNWETLIRGFYLAFRKSDDVCLVIKTDKPADLQAAVARIKKLPEFRSKDTAPIYPERRSLCTFEEIPHIMKQADVIVSTSLGEGFGLVGMHSMALKIPLITVNYGGATQYAKQEYCTLIEPSRFEKILMLDKIPQFRSRIWPTVTVESVAEALKFCRSSPAVISHKAEKAYEFVHRTMGYQAIGPLFASALTGDLT